ncbi:purple acid phosphatase family protein [Pararhodonellum marinum]|uniref:purple acid phosphatase family protein n=1 Tax=Pararhodonellum marinum TaxID=2755358 RepID=UPI001E520CA7|nr:metallophosphoesterase family protein [Pararhodonellum marinum]
MNMISELRTLKVFIISFLLVGSTFNAVIAQEEVPSGIMLSWKDDPTTTMCLDWHTPESQTQNLFYRLKGSEEWQGQTGETFPFPFSSDRFVQRVELTGLTPNTAYEVKFSDKGKVFHFITMPEHTHEEAIRIAIGGDSMHERAFMEKTNQLVVKYDPHFAIIGGDLAYANGLEENLNRWYDWFEALKELITPEGKIIPVVVCIGNHEVKGGYFSKHEDYTQSDASRLKIAPYFYPLFTFPGQPGYSTLDFGNYLSLFILDTQHSNPIEGQQTDWLKKALTERKDTQHLIPIYHVPAFPSARDFDGEVHALIRENWVPLFESFGVTLAFENHDHTYKRTYPIRNQQVDDTGVVYIGDGAWGTRTREVHPVDQTWYLNKAVGIRNFTLLSIQGSEKSMMMFDEEGNLLDSYPELPKIKAP